MIRYSFKLKRCFWFGIYDFLNDLLLVVAVVVGVDICGLEVKMAHRLKSPVRVRCAREGRG